MDIKSIVIKDTETQNINLTIDSDFIVLEDNKYYNFQLFVRKYFIYANKINEI